MSKSRLKLSQAIPALALAAAVVAPMPQALSVLSATSVAMASSNPCAPSGAENPCAPAAKKSSKKAGNPCAPTKGTKKKSDNPCAPN